jgi:pSer/pThr/pTyr-binding forkhead associated (FHA) protein
MSKLLVANLGIVCPTCDHLSPARSATCAGCGESLFPTLAAASPKPKLKAVEPAAAPAAAVPPNMRPTAKAAALSPAPAEEPIPASDLVKKPAPAAAPKFGLAVLSGPSQGQRFRLSATATVGRSKGVILFPDDPYVSPLHATLLTKEGDLFIRDEGSTSGVFVSISSETVLPPNSFFAVGQRLFRYLGTVPLPVNRGGPAVYGAPLPSNQAFFALEEVLIGGRPGRTAILTGKSFSIGQDKCDFSYPGDEGLAPRHCEVLATSHGAQLSDHSGQLGTFVRIPANTERGIKIGDRIRIGQQVLQVQSA